MGILFMVVVVDIHFMEAVVVAAEATAAAEVTVAVAEVVVAVVEVDAVAVVENEYLCNSDIQIFFNSLLIIS